MSDTQHLTSPTLSEGTYELAESVRNPCVDRRQKYDWRRSSQLIVVGTRFQVEAEYAPEELQPDASTKILIGYRLINLSARNKLSTSLLVPLRKRQPVPDWKGKLAAAILPHLVPVTEPSPDSETKAEQVECCPTSDSLSLQVALELAAKTLPDGYEVSVKVERNAGWVEVTDPNGDQIEVPTNGDQTLAEQVEACRSAALAHQASR